MGFFWLLIVVLFFTTAAIADFNGCIFLGIYLFYFCYYCFRNIATIDFVANVGLRYVPGVL